MGLAPIRSLVRSTTYSIQSRSCLLSHGYAHTIKCALLRNQENILGFGHGPLYTGGLPSW